MLLALAAVGGCGSSTAPSQAQPLEVTLLRDSWGVPHVFAPTDEAAMYGVGWAAAEDRLFQMLYTRLMAHGRLSEFFGPGFEPGKGDVNVANDLAVRHFGWRRWSIEAAAQLDPATYALLDAYAQGVSEAMQAPSTKLHPLIAQHGIPLDPWQVEDCIAVWLRFGALFGADGTEEVLLLRKWDELLATLPFEEAYEELLSGSVCDDEAAVVQQHDVPPATQQAMADYAASQGLDGLGQCLPGLPSPNFSQAWAVAGERTFSGDAVLVGDARATVTWPNQFYEWSVEGATISVRGAGVAGSPIVVSGCTANAAWSPTALGLDHADLYAITTDPGGHPGQYLLDGAWRDFEVDEFETLRVLGAADLQVHYRETAFGPLVTPLIDEALPGEEFALRRVPLHDPSRDPSVGAFRMMRAGDLDELYAALGDWSFPAMNMVFADGGGRVGYAVAGDVPTRKPGLLLAGLLPQDGSDSANDWPELLPHGLEPHVLDPAAGTVHSANHLPVGSWYPIPIRFGTNGAGDTLRSHRLTELLGVLAPSVSVDEVQALRLDTVNTGRRDLVQLGLYLRDVQSSWKLSAEAESALVELEPWWLAGARMDGSHPAAALAWMLDSTFHVGDASSFLRETYGGGENGLTLFLKLNLQKAAANAPLGPEEAAYVDQTLAAAWLAASAIGPSTSWPSWYQSQVLTFEVDNWKTLEDLVPPSGSASPLVVGPAPCNDHGALSTTSDQAYTQVTEPGSGAMARSLLPPGASEHAGAHDQDQVAGWKSGLTKPAPRTLNEVQASGPVTQSVLRYVPSGN